MCSSMCYYLVFHIFMILNKTKSNLHVQRICRYVLCSKELSYISLLSIEKKTCLKHCQWRLNLNIIKLVKWRDRECEEYTLLRLRNQNWIIRNDLFRNYDKKGILLSIINACITFLKWRLNFIAKKVSRWKLRASSA